ncbi:MAG: putative ABC transporter permease [Tissierellia bacterium]|nr:putative ABC transporter permease [Tissierellia bacterium]
MAELIYRLDLFFIYAFLGFVWETLWVSYNKKQWVQRGFLHGPILPIYGFGATIIIAITEPLQGHNIAIYFVGMVTATLLELVTGYTLEKLFHVRYWDYDNRPFNYKGYICLRSSLFWGLLPIFLVNDVDQWIRELLVQIPQEILIALTGISSLLFVVDVWISAKEAFELKDILYYERELSSYMDHLKKNLKEQRMERREEFFKGLEELKKQELSDGIGNKFRGKVALILSRKIEEKKRRERKAFQKLETVLSENIARGELPTLSGKALELVHYKYDRRMERLKRVKKNLESLLKRNDISMR